MTASCQVCVQGCRLLSLDVVELSGRLRPHQLRRRQPQRQTYCWPAARAVHAAGTRWVLDPVAVGAGATAYDAFVASLLEYRPTDIRGNAGELLALLDHAQFLDGSPARTRFDRRPGLEADEGPGVSGLKSTALTALTALGTTCPQPYSIEEPEPVAGGEPPGVVHQIPVRQIGVGP
ncbi:hydroxyethylthiazole kinase [Streptomyces olivochromogenes]|uniref:hydroxyethylthiazole kinase n=1 Tax=Streptomyces olivochromogenes TaxID=1963 RepID=UPI0036AA823E